MAGVISQVCKSCFSKVEEMVILDPQALRRHSEIKAVGVRPQQIREKKELFFSNKIVIRKLKQLAASFANSTNSTNNTRLPIFPYLPYIIKRNKSSFMRRLLQLEEFTEDWKAGKRLIPQRKFLVAKALL